MEAVVGDAIGQDQKFRAVLLPAQDDLRVERVGEFLGQVLEEEPGIAEEHLLGGEEPAHQIGDEMGFPVNCGKTKRVPGGDDGGSRAAINEHTPNLEKRAEKEFAISVPLCPAGHGIKEVCVSA